MITTRHTASLGDPDPSGRALSMIHFCTSYLGIRPSYYLALSYSLPLDWSMSRDFREIFETSEFCSFARLSRRNFARCETGFEGPNLPKWPKFLSGGEGQFEFCCLTSSKYTFLGTKNGRALLEYPFLRICFKSESKVGY